MSNCPWLKHAVPFQNANLMCVDKYVHVEANKKQLFVITRCIVGYIYCIPFNKLPANPPAADPLVANVWTQCLMLTERDT